MIENCAINLKNFAYSTRMDPKVEQHKRNTRRRNWNQMVAYENSESEGKNVIWSISRGFLRLIQIEIIYICIYLAVLILVVLRMKICLHSGLDLDKAASLLRFDSESGSRATVTPNFRT